MKEFNQGQQQIITEGLIRGLDVRVYARLDFSLYHMRELANLLKPGVEIPELWNSDFTYEQVYVFLYYFGNGCDLRPYLRPEFNHRQLRAIGNGLIHGLDVAIYATPKYNSKQMHQIYLGLLNGLDVSQYADPSISSDRMKYIRLCLEDKLDESELGKSQ